MNHCVTDNQIKKYLYLGIHYHANNYYRKQSNYSSKVTLIDFQDLDNWHYSHKNYSEFSDITSINNFFDFINQLENDSLITTLVHLSDKEKAFIFEKFFLQKTDTEIAKEKDLSQQAVSLYKKRLLKKIKQFMC